MDFQNLGTLRISSFILKLWRYVLLYMSKISHVSNKAWHATMHSRIIFKLDCFGILKSLNVIPYMYLDAYFCFCFLKFLFQMNDKV